MISGQWRNYKCVALHHICNSLIELPALFVPKVVQGFPAGVGSKVRSLRDGDKPPLGRPNRVNHVLPSAPVRASQIYAVGQAWQWG